MGDLLKFVCTCGELRLFSLRMWQLGPIFLLKNFVTFEFPFFFHQVLKFCQKHY